MAIRSRHANLRVVSLHQAPYKLHATVLGAGTMGAQIAAHLANAGVRTTLLDLPTSDDGDSSKGRSKRNLIAQTAKKALLKTKPPALMSRSALERIAVGNFDDDLEAAVQKSDLVIEAVIERLDIKQQLFTKVAAAAPKHTILATNTSGIPVHAIAESLDDSAKKRLLGLHFFNPPRFMHLLEVVPSKYTDTAVVDAASRFCDQVLGKGVVLCRDTPNFIGNRIGIGEMLLTFQATKAGSFSVEEVDLLNGTLMGRPKMGSYRLGDMIGLDVVAHVINNLKEAVGSEPGSENFDPLHEIMEIPELLAKMIESKKLGDKTRGGFYRKAKDSAGKRVIESLDLNTLEYRAKEKAQFEGMKEVKRIPQLERRVHEAIRMEGRAGDFLRQVYLPLFNYSAHLAGKICETPKDIDDAMVWGYGWKKGPFALMDAAGVQWSLEKLKEMGIEPAPMLVSLVEKEGEKASWFKEESANEKVYVGDGKYSEIQTPAGMIILAQHKEREIEKSSTASLLDIGDGVAVLEFRSKMNILDEGVVTLLNQAPDILPEKGFRALVVGNQGEDFCVGANLMQVMGWIMQKQWGELEKAVKAFQDTMMKLRHADIPVVVAPFGKTLGGGVELTLHADRIQAGADTFMGLVEMGVGLLPAGGGLKEICRRASEWAASVPGADPYEWIRRGFEAAATAKVSMSAFEAQETGWLTPQDGITFHKSRVIADAKQQAISLAEGGYLPPDPNQAIQVIGAPRGASFLLGAQLFEWGGYATEHDKKIAKKIAHVLSGGMHPTATQVSAQHLLDLEREAFVSLAGEEKTLARIQHMLQSGKPLRN